MSIRDSFCKQCGKYMWVGSSPHVCPPRWLVWCPDHGETESDARTIYAADAEGAAEEWAEIDDRDSAEYCIVGGDEVTVHVRLDDDFADDEVTAWVVTGESVPSYSATSVGVS